MEKRYGKLTAPQFSEFIGFLPQVLALIKEANDLLASVSSDRFNAAMTGDYGDYCHLYERPFAEHLAWVLIHRADSRTRCNKDEPGEGWLRMRRHHGHLNRQVQVARCTSTSAEKNHTKFTVS